MPITPGTNCMTIAEDKLAAMIASLGDFQLWTGTSDSTAAADHVFINALPRPEDQDTYTLDELIAFGNHVVVSTAEEEGFSLSFEARGSADEFGASGTKMLDFFAVPTGEYNPDNAEAQRLFDNATLDILIALSDESSQDTNIALEGIEHVMTFFAPEDHFPEQGLWVGSRWSVPHLSAINSTSGA